MRFTFWTLGLGVVGVVGAAGANAVTRHPEPTAAARPSSRVASAKPATVIPNTTVASASVMQQGRAVSAPAPKPDSTPQAQAAVSTPAASPVAVDSSSQAATPSVPVKATIAVVIPQGRSELADSMFAERSGDSVVVHFDTSPARTRRAEKFERIVRQTLHAVYGAVADTVLATIPEGKLVVSGDLLTVLPTRGIRLESEKRGIMLWPETRPGRDGPLVVAYRTTLAR